MVSRADKASASRQLKLQLEEGLRGVRHGVGHLVQARRAGWQEAQDIGILHIVPDAIGGHYQDVIRLDIKGGHVRILRGVRACCVLWGIAELEGAVKEVEPSLCPVEHLTIPHMHEYTVTLRPPEISERISIVETF